MRNCLGQVLCSIRHNKRIMKNHLNGYARQVVFSIYEQKSSRIVQKTEEFHLHFASFFRFMATYFSLTQFVTRARPRWWV